MKRRVATSVCLLTLLLPSLPAQAADPPPSLPVHEYQLPEVTQATLANGIRVLVVPRSDNPVVRANLVLRGGDSTDPPGREGLATMAAAVLTTGTEDRTNEEIATAMDGIGATLAATSSRDWLSVSISVLSEYAATGFELLGDVVQHPTFPADQVEKNREQYIVSERADATDQETIASRAFYSILYGSHPYGRAPSLGSLRKISRDDLVRFWSEQATPRGALLVIVGDVTAESALQLAEQSLGGWRSDREPPRRAMPALPQSGERTIYLIDRPGSTQAEIVAGHLIPATSREERVQLRVLNSVLSPRLYSNLREDKGYTYGAYSGFAFPLDRGYFVAEAAVRNEVAGEALRELLFEIERIRRERISDYSLDYSKGYLAGNYALSLETNADLAREITGLALRDRPLEDLSSYLGIVDSVDAATLQRAAQRFIQPDRLAIIVVGDASILQPQLAAVGKVVRAGG